jgi:NTE family protein
METTNNEAQNTGAAALKRNLSSGDVKYLCFEGGGGKGVIYLGAIRALEQLIAGGKGRPLIEISKAVEDRQIKGISGASAGSITAFLLAMGLSSKDIESVMNDTDMMDLSSRNSLNPVPGKVKVSRFEKFFEVPDTKRHRIVVEPDDPYTSGHGKVDTRNFEFNNMMVNGTSVLEIVSRPLKSIRGIIADTANLAYGKGFMPIPIRRLLFDTYRTEVLNDTFKATPVSSITEPVKNALRVAGSKIFQSEFVDYMHSVLFNRGIFPGKEPVKLFADLLQKYLLSKADKDAKGNLLYSAHQNALDITFEDFFNLTGVDLVVTGTNVTHKAFRYFSVYHTPRFPVVYAIAISMNIPFAFRPIFVNYEVNRRVQGNERTDYRIRYAGLYVDGGMLNNYPIHAFDTKASAEALQLKHKGKIAKTEVGAENDHFHNSYVNDNILGFRLSEHVNFATELTKVFDTSELDYKIMTSYSASLLGSFMSAGSEGQITSQELKNQTIELETTDISLFDFSTPDLDKERGIKIDPNLALMNDDPLLPLKPNMEMYKYKDELIKAAERKTMKYFK